MHRPRAPRRGGTTRAARPLQPFRLGMHVLRPLARLTHRWRWIVLGVFAALLVAGEVYGAGAGEVLAGGGFTDPNSESVRAQRALEDTFGVRQPDVVVVYSHPSATYRDPQFAGPLRAVLARLRDAEGVDRVTSPYQAGGEGLVSEDGRAVMITLELAGTDAVEKEAHFARLEPSLDARGLTTLAGGPVPLDRQAQQAAADDLRRGELITIPILAILLIVFFRGVVAAALPMAIGIFAIGGALSCIRLLAHVTDVSIFAMNIVVFIGLGVAVDYSLFVTSRFREELAAGQTVPAAVEHTMQTAGRTVAYSGLVVAVSMLGMLAFPVVLLRSVAISGALVVAMTLLATLVFLPAGLAVLGHRIEWLRIGRQDAARRGRGWRRLANLVMRAPIAVTATTSALLLLLGTPFLRMEQVVGGAGTLPTRAEAREVAEMLESGRFPAARRSTLTVVLSTDAQVLSREGLRAVTRYADAVAELPGVERVQAVAGAGAPLSSAEVLAMRGALPRELRAVVRGDQTIVRVIGSDPPSSDEAMELVRAVRGVEVPGASALVGGQAAQRVDLASTIERGLPWAIGAICLVTFVVLFLAFGSVVMPLKAIAMNVLSLTASFGALVWIFQDGRFERLLGYESTGTIELTIPVVMFAVMFGLAMDYELFLLSRIREEYDRHEDTRASVAFGIEHTGTIITRAALLLVAVMLGFVAADMLLIKELGVGMIVAIVVDVTIVRGLLVPATMQLLGHYNWWAPGPLARWWCRTGIGVDESPPPICRPEHRPG